LPAMRDGPEVGNRKISKKLIDRDFRDANLLAIVGLIPTSVRLTLHSNRVLDRRQEDDFAYQCWTRVGQH
jgi:hypothetical protein